MFKSASSPVLQTVARTRNGPFIRGITLLIGLLAVCIGSSSAVDAEPAQPRPNLHSFLKAEAELRHEIEVEVGSAACAHDAQCRVLGLGALACGGPEGWLAWSPSSCRPEVVQAKAARLQAMARERNRRFGLASQCVVLTEPLAVCRLGRCVLQQVRGLD